MHASRAAITVSVVAAAAVAVSAGLLLSSGGPPGGGATAAVAGSRPTPNARQAARLRQNAVPAAPRLQHRAGRHRAGQHRTGHAPAVPHRPDRADQHHARHRAADRAQVRQPWTARLRLRGS